MSYATDSLKDHLSAIFTYLFIFLFIKHYLKWRLTNGLPVYWTGSHSLLEVMSVN